MRPEVKIDGARDLRRIAGKVAGPDGKKALRDIHKSAGDRVARRAERMSPRRTGEAARTIRGLGTLSKAEIALGRGPVKEWIGVLVYGDPARNKPANPFPFDAVSKELPDVRDEIEEKYRQLAGRLATD